MESTTTWGWAMRAGAKAVAPQLIGVIPFGLVAGATPADGGLGIAAAAGFSGIVFAGHASIIIGAFVGIAGGAFTDYATGRRAQ